MNMEKASQEWASGSFLVIGEYRNSRSEMLNWRDKQTGASKSAPILRHTVEVGNTSCAVNERVPDNTKLEDIRIPWRKGEIVAVRLTEMSTDKGMVSLRGTLEKIQDGSASQANQTPVGGAVRARPV